MMSSLGLACLALLLPVADGPAKPPPPTDAEIRAAVAQLGSDKFSEREKATRLLMAAGSAAEAALREVIDSPDPEVRRRARGLLDRIIYRIDPDTPPAVVALMQRYRTGTPAEQSDVIQQMLKMGSKAHPYLLRLLDAVDQEKRGKILELFAYDDWKILVPLMADGQEAVVAALLEKAAGAQIDSIVPHYAAFHAVTGRLPAAKARLRAEVEKSGGQFRARLLAAVCRLADDPDGVVWAAERAGQSELVRLVLAERGQWGELLTKFTPSVGDGYGKVYGLGLTAAYQRLAGRDADLRRTLKQIEEYAAAPPQKPPQASMAAKALLINEQTAAAVELLTRHEQFQQAADLQFAQGRYREALALSERAAKAEAAPNFQARAVHVLNLLRVGDRAGAGQWLDTLAKDLATVTSPNWLDQRIDLEVKVGRLPQAERRLLDRLDEREDSDLAGCFAAVFPELGTPAETLWRLLRHTRPKEAAADALARLRRIAAGKEPADLAALVRVVPDAAWLPQPRVAAAFEHLAAVVYRLGRADLAAALLKDAGWGPASPAARLLLADTLADAGQWPAATDAYRAAWDADRTDALPYFLYGAALTRVGKADEGKAIMARSHRLPLGSESARRNFHEALVERGFAADAREELRVWLRLAAPDRTGYGLALDHTARHAIEAGDHRAAAAMFERNLVRLVQGAATYSSVSAYMRVTATVHALRAKAELAQGRVAEALREVERAEALHPAHLDLPILLTADLEKAGERERAAKLFDRLYALLEQNCRDYPACADAHNQLAWLAARCRRRLDDALPHARKAVELALQTAVYADTLAELLFQRGDRAAAVELMRKCLKPRSVWSGYFHRQLQRFEAGDPRTEPPRSG